MYTCATSLITSTVPKRQNWSNLSNVHLSRQYTARLPTSMLVTITMDCSTSVSEYRGGYIKGIILWLVQM